MMFLSAKPCTRGKESSTAMAMSVLSSLSRDRGLLSLKASTLDMTCPLCQTGPTMIQTSHAVRCLRCKRCVFLHKVSCCCFTCCWSCWRMQQKCSAANYCMCFWVLFFIPRAKFFAWLFVITVIIHSSLRPFLVPSASLMPAVRKSCCHAVHQGEYLSSLTGSGWPQATWPVSVTVSSLKGSFHLNFP